MAANMAVPLVVETAAWTPAVSPPPVSHAPMSQAPMSQAPMSWPVEAAPRPASTPPGKVVVDLAPLNEFRPMSIVKHRSLKYYQNMDEQRQQRAQELKQGVGRCTPGATRAAATRIRTEAQLHTLTQLFVDMARMRQDMPPQVYAALHAAAVKLNQPDGKINPSNRSGTPLYTDLHRSLLDMRMSGELGDADVEADPSPLVPAPPPLVNWSGQYDAPRQTLPDLPDDLDFPDDVNMNAMANASYDANASYGANASYDANDRADVCDQGAAVLPLKPQPVVLKPSAVPPLQLPASLPPLGPLNMLWSANTAAEAAPKRQHLHIAAAGWDFGEEEF